MEIKVQRQRAWKQVLAVMMLAGAAITGSVVAPAFQSNGVQVSYADECDGGSHNPPIIECMDPTPTPTATPDPEHP